MLRPVLIRLSRDRRLRSLTVHNPMVRTMAHRFVAGETLRDAIRAVCAINSRGMSATLDHLGENVSTADEAEEAANTYCRMLDEITREGLNCNVSLKLTHMGLDLGEDLAFDNTRRVVERAAGLENFVRIDMESSEYTDRTLDVFHRLFDAHKNVGIVIQSMLHRSDQDLAKIIEVGARVRLVKGAYLEPSSVAYQAKSDVDASYVREMRMLLARGNYPALATHDPKMIEATIDFARERNIPARGYEFQMLYGIRRDLQTGLKAQGHNVRIYVPYGTEWYPYLMRRMAERPANLMFFLGNVAREALPGSSR